MLQPNELQPRPTLSHFWMTLPRPIIGLAPMDGVGDHPFRHIQKKYGNPAVIYTEFTIDGVERIPVSKQYYDQLADLL
jgi:tRNA-dihydrouridine synthase